MKLHGTKIRVRRLELGLSLSDVTDATDIDKSDLSKVERGLGGLGPKRARALAACLQVSMDEIAPDLAELKQKIAS